IEAPSSFWNAFPLQPGSTTITASGRQPSATPRSRIAAMMRLACANVRAAMASRSPADRLAQRMGGIDAEDLERVRLGEERQLFERELEAGVVGMTFHVGIELGGGE